MTDLCVAIFASDIAQVKRDVLAAAEAGADVVELRLDRITDDWQAASLVEQSILPCILTCRPTWEGGESELPDYRRAAMLSFASHKKNAHCIDLELESYRRNHRIRESLDLRVAEEPMIQGVDVPEGLLCWAETTIFSSHDFKGRPD